VLDAARCSPPRAVAEDLAGEVRNASCGLGFTVCRSARTALGRVALDVPAVRALGLADGPSAGLSVVAWDGTSARCRVFAFEAGGREDPATGSAALALGAWLVATGALPDGGAYDVVQGVEMGRPSLLSCTVTAVRRRAVSATSRAGGRSRRATGPTPASAAGRDRPSRRTSGPDARTPRHA
jgi:trans-2,3-dihydro-3-hydroxyanthranilate isomerase